MSSLFEDKLQDIDINELRNNISREDQETAIKNIILDNFEVDSIEFRNSFFEQVQLLNQLTYLH